jgi:hypothetical protein
VTSTSPCHYDYLVSKCSQVGLGTAWLTPYFAETYTIQRLILQARTQRPATSSRQAISDPGTRTSW